MSPVFGTAGNVFFFGNSRAAPQRVVQGMERSVRGARLKRERKKHKAQMSKSDTFDYSAAAKSLQERLEKQKHLRHERYRKAQADAGSIIQMIARKYNPTRIYQWGSLLDPERFDENSDIDIAVEGIDGPERFFSMRAEACAMTDMELDLVEMEHIDDPARESIRTWGKVVYERA
jgi:predicted nucleotidyltransferase